MNEVVSHLLICLPTTQPSGNFCPLMWFRSSAFYCNLVVTRISYLEVRSRPAACQHREPTEPRAAELICMGVPGCCQRGDGPAALEWEPIKASAPLEISLKIYPATEGFNNQQPV